MLAAAHVPASLQVDAQLTEWAVFATGKPSPLTPSFVVVTATADSVVLAGRVRNLPQQGLWLRLESDAPELPPIGTLERGGGIIPLQCDVSDVPDGAHPFDPETCQRLMQGYDELQKSYAATFVRQLHLTAQALSVRTGEQEQAVAGAKYAFSADGESATFEAVLPLTALPRTASAELSSLTVVAERADSARPPEVTPEVAQSVSFAPPIRFGMDSDLLGCLQMQGSNVSPTTPRFSYQPGVPNRVSRVANVDGLSLDMKEVTLSNREAVLGALEVRSVQGASPLVAILKEGQLLDCRSVGDVLGVVERGRGLHVIGYDEEQDPAVGLYGAAFRVLEIAKDGTLHDDLLEAPERGFGYMTVGQAHTKNLASFSISGMYQADEGGSQQHTLSWRYDARLDRYGVRERKGRYVPPDGSQ